MTIHYFTIKGHYTNKEYLISIEANEYSAGYEVRMSEPGNWHKVEEPDIFRSGPYYIRRDRPFSGKFLFWQEWQARRAIAKIENTTASLDRRRWAAARSVEKKELLLAKKAEKNNGKS